METQQTQPLECHIGPTEVIIENPVLTVAGGSTDGFFWFCIGCYGHLSISVCNIDWAAPGIGGLFNDALYQHVCYLLLNSLLVGLWDAVGALSGGKCVCGGGDFHLILDHQPTEPSADRVGGV